MPLSKLHAWFQNVLPTVYDSASLSLYEAMGKVMYKLNEVIDLINMLEANQPNVEDYVINILNKWLDDGTLANIINNEVLNGKADGHVLSLTSFGADPTGVQDSTSAFNQAISKARSDSYKLVVYPGQYNLSSYIFTDYSLFIEDLGTYPNSKLIYCKPLKGKLHARNFYSFQYQFTDNVASSNSPIPWNTQGILFHLDSQRLYCAGDGFWTTAEYNGDSFTKIRTVTNRQIGHSSSITMDSTNFYFSESPGGISKFNRNDRTYRGVVNLPNLTPEDSVAHFNFNFSTNLFYAYVHMAGSSSPTICLYDKNLNFLKSFSIPHPNGVVQSSNWIENNLIAVAYDSNWDHDEEFGGMFLDIFDICSERRVYSFPFGNIRQFNECQGFTKFNDDGDYIIYSYSQQKNIQSLFLFNFNEYSNSNPLPLESTSDTSIASIYPDKYLVVNSKSYPYLFKGTVIENKNNANDNIPLGSDIINISPYLKGSASYPFLTPQAAAANVGKFGKYTILLCGDTDFTRAPNGHLVIQGADHVCIKSILSDTSIKVECPPIYITDCKKVELYHLYISNDLPWNVIQNNHNWPTVCILDCNCVNIENCDIGFASLPSGISDQYISVGSGIYLDSISKINVSSTSTTNCRSGLVIRNSNFTLGNFTVGNCTYPIVLANSIGTRNNGTNSNVYSYYIDDLPCLTSNINFVGVWGG